MGLWGYNYLIHNKLLPPPRIIRRAIISSEFKNYSFEYKKIQYLCNPEPGTLAQSVQSACFTRKRSAVRICQVPQVVNKLHLNELSKKQALFPRGKGLVFCNLAELEIWFFADIGKNCYICSRSNPLFADVHGNVIRKSVCRTEWNLWAYSP